MAKLNYIAFADRQCPPDWRAEALDLKTGDSYIAIFSGPEAERRAVEYAAFKNGTIPALVEPRAAQATAPAPAPTTQDTFKIVTVNGHALVIRPANLDWRYDVKRELLKATPKAALELLRKGL